MRDWAIVQRATLKCRPTSVTAIATSPSIPIFPNSSRTRASRLRADQKTDVWCTAKLERYLFEMDGFVSIIPRRLAADESITYSPYIARELMLARRSRGPGILFVDGQLLTQYQSQFPPWAVPFFHEEPGTEQVRHNKAIADFRRTLGRGNVRAARKYQPRRATVIGGSEPMLRDAANHVAAILRSEDYTPTVTYAAGMDEAFDDIDVFESMLGLGGVRLRPRQGSVLFRPVPRDGACALCAVRPLAPRSVGDERGSGAVGCRALDVTQRLEATVPQGVSELPQRFRTSGERR